MTTKIEARALIPNPALKPFEKLVGEWKTEGTMTIKESGNKLITKGEMSSDGGEWKKDLSVTYKRVK